MSIVDLCEEGSVVLNIDADDQLIGRQVMKLLNALYQSSSKWFIYSNFVAGQRPKLERHFEENSTINLGHQHLQNRG